MSWIILQNTHIPKAKKMWISLRGKDNHQMQYQDDPDTEIIKDFSAVIIMVISKGKKNKPKMSKHRGILCRGIEHLEKYKKI